MRCLRLHNNVIQMIGGCYIYILAISSRVPATSAGFQAGGMGLDLSLKYDNIATKARTGAISGTKAGVSAQDGAECGAGAGVLFVF